MLHPYQKATNLDLQLPFLTHLLLRVMSLQRTHTVKCKTERMQDGEDGCVSGRRKRRPRSELILAYQCTVCGKRYASGPALSLHKKNTHKQPAVPCDEHTKASNSSVDKGSQGPSKRRRRKKSEIDRPFSCSVCGKKYSALYNKTKHGS
eukprot:Em0015g1165a